MKAVVFDFDGVIANSEPLHFRAFRDVLAGEGITLGESEYYERYLGYNDERAFLARAAEAKFVNLKGHRSVGGCRASLYNALPEAGAQALAQFMADFRTGRR